MLRDSCKSRANSTREIDEKILNTVLTGNWNLFLNPKMTSAESMATIMRDYIVALRERGRSC